MDAFLRIAFQCTPLWRINILELDVVFVDVCRAWEAVVVEQLIFFIGSLEEIL